MDDETGYICSAGAADKRLFVRRGSQDEELLAFEGCVFVMRRISESRSLQHASNEITFGSRFCLVHKQSGLVLALMASQPSELDNDCYTVTLLSQEGASHPSTHFRFVPRYKVHSEGDYVCQGDQVLIVLADRNLYIHASEEGLPVTEVTLRSGAAIDDVIEINGSEKSTSWILHRYDVGTEDSDFLRVVSRTSRAGITAGVPVALFHREREAFLVSSLTKPPTSETSNVLPITRRRHSSVMSERASLSKPVSPTSSMYSERHLPYPLFLVQQNYTNDATFAEISLNCTALWIVEGADPTRGGPVRIGDEYRLRQAVTNLYLSADLPDSADLRRGCSSDGFGEMMPSTSLASIRGDANLSLVPPPSDDEGLRRTLFVFSHMFQSDARYIVEREFFRLQHVVSGLWVCTDGDASLKQTKIRLESKPTLHDALLMGHIRNDVQQDVLFLFHNTEYLKRYCKLMQRCAEKRAALDLSPKARDKEAAVAARCCTEALTNLIYFCSVSEDENPFSREGLPIIEHQQMMHDTRLHCIVFDVITAPFVTTSSHISGFLPQQPLTGGVVELQNLLNPENAAIHNICRLGFRLLRQMVRGTPQFAVALGDYVPYMFNMDGMKLHVVETMHEIFTDNPKLPLTSIDSASRHYIEVLKGRQRSAGYLRFLAAMCCAGMSGIRENQHHICRLLLQENSKVLLRVVLLESGFVAVHWSEKEPPARIDVFLTQHNDAKLVKYFEAELEIFNKICVGSAKQCVLEVEKFITTVQLDGILSTILWTGQEKQGMPSRLDTTRANLFLLAMNLYVLAELRNTDVTLRQSTVLFGGSSLRVKDAVMYSGVEDSKLMASTKRAAMHLLEHNRHMVLEDKPRNALIQTVVDVWQQFVLYWQYSAKDVECLVPILLDLLDGSQDILHLKNSSTAVMEEKLWNRYARSEESIVGMDARRSVCKAFSTLLGNAVRVAADRIVLVANDLISRLATEESADDATGGGSTRRGRSSVSEIFHSSLSFIRLTREPVKGPVRSPTFSRLNSFRSGPAAGRRGAMSSANSGKPDGEGFPSTIDELVEFFEDECRRTAELFNPKRLLPLLLDTSLYQSDELAADAMNLLVSMCSVARDVAALVLSVPSCPPKATVETFDRLYLVTVELSNAVQAQREADADDTSDLEAAIEMVLKTLFGSYKPRNLAGTPDHAAQQGEDLPLGTNSFKLGSQVQRVQSEDDEDQSPSPKHVKSALKGKGASRIAQVAAVARIVAFSKNVQRKRNASGVAASSDVPLEVVQRAELMRHWKVHEMLLTALKSISMSDAAYTQVIRFFYYFTLAPTNARELQQHVSIFVRGLSHPEAHAECMHIIISIISSSGHASSDVVGDELLDSLVNMIAREAKERNPDSSFIKLINRSIAAKHLSLHAHRKLLQSLHGRGAFANVQDVSGKMNSAEMLFNSSLVTLLCNTAAMSSSVRSIAQRLLPHKKCIEILLRSSRSDGELPKNHQAPYCEALTLMHFYDSDDSPSEKARVRLHWFQNNQLWTLMTRIGSHYQHATTLLHSYAAALTNAEDVSAASPQQSVRLQDKDLLDSKEASNIAKTSINAVSSDVAMLLSQRHFWFVAVPNMVRCFFKTQFSAGLSLRFADTVFPTLTSVCIPLCEFAKAVQTLDRHFAQLSPVGVELKPLRQCVAELGQCCAELSLVHIAERLEFARQDLAATEAARSTTSGGMLSSLSSPQLSLALSKNQSNIKEALIRSFRSRLEHSVGHDFVIDPSYLKGDPTGIAVGMFLNADHKQSQSDIILVKLLAHLKKLSFSTNTIAGLLNLFNHALTEAEKAAVEQQDDQVLSRLQVHFDALGMMRVATALSDLSDDIVTKSGLDLGISLLEGGNLKVQNSMLDYFESHDETFFHNVREILHQCLDSIRGLPENEIHRDEHSESNVAHDKAAAGHKLSQLKLLGEVLRFLQLMCEGHHLGMQNYIREQQDNLHSINIVHEVISVVRELFEHLDDSKIPVLVRGFALLTEFCQGPCPDNQAALLNNDVCALVSQLLDTPYTGDAADEFSELSMTVTTTLIAVLEGCNDSSVYEKVIAQVPVHLLSRKMQELLAQLGDDLLREGDNRVECLFNYLIFLHSVLPFVATDEKRQEIVQALQQVPQLSSLLGSVEVQRDSRVEKVYFRIPSICISLTQHSKDDLLWSVDRSTRSTKLADFFHKSDELIFEIDSSHRYEQALLSHTRLHVDDLRPPTTIVGKAVNALKSTFNSIIPWFITSDNSYYETLSLLIAMMLNIIFIATDGIDHDPQHVSVVERVVWYLAFIQLICCAELLLYDTLVFLPVSFYRLFKMRRRQLGNLKVNATQEEVYAELPWRDKLTHSLSRFQTMYRVAMIVASLLSLVFDQPYFNAIHLSGLVYRSSMLRTVIIAITQNSKSLCLTMGLGVIIVYMFAIIGYNYFPKAFDLDGSEENCTTLFRCFVYILIHGLRQGGGVADIMQPEKWSGENVYHRFGFDFVFFALVNVIFLNILFGIIIDTFAELRDDKRKKEEDMNSCCFICGISADVFDREGGGFRRHVAKEHNMWQFLYFMHHLRLKERNDYTGQESYVADKIRENDLSFFPHGKALSLRSTYEAADEDVDETTEVDRSAGPSATSAPSSRREANVRVANASANGGDSTNNVQIAAQQNAPRQDLDGVKEAVQQAVAQIATEASSLRTMLSEAAQGSAALTSFAFNNNSSLGGINASSVIFMPQGNQPAPHRPRARSATAGDVAGHYRDLAALERRAGPDDPPDSASQSGDETSILRTQLNEARIEMSELRQKLLLTQQEVLKARSEADDAQHAVVELMQEHEESLAAVKQQSHQLVASVPAALAPSLAVKEETLSSLASDDSGFLAAKDRQLTDVGTSTEKTWVDAASETTKKIVADASIATDATDVTSVALLEAQNAALRHRLDELAGRSVELESQAAALGQDLHVERRIATEQSRQNQVKAAVITELQRELEDAKMAQRRTHETTAGAFGTIKKLETEISRLKQEMTALESELDEAIAGYEESQRYIVEDVPVFWGNLMRDLIYQREGVYPPPIDFDELLGPTRYSPSTSRSDRLRRQ